MFLTPAIQKRACSLPGLRNRSGIWHLPSAGLAKWNRNHILSGRELLPFATIWEPAVAIGLGIHWYNVLLHWNNLFIECRTAEGMATVLPEQSDQTCHLGKDFCILESCEARINIV